MPNWFARYSQMQPAAPTPGAVPSPPPGGGTSETRDMTGQAQVNARNIDGDVQQGIIRPMTNLLGKDVTGFLDLVAAGDPLAKFVVQRASVGQVSAFIRAVASYNNIQGAVLGGTPNGMVALGQWAMGIRFVTERSPFESLLTRILQVPGVLENQRR